LRIRTFILLTLAFCTVTAGAQTSSPPKREVRAVWLTTAAGLDWPHSTDKAEQQASLREIVRRLKAYNFNTIFFQARSRGDAYYHSAYEPWADNLTGTLGKDPGWDPLAFLINEAHALGIEVHAWFNVYKVRSNGWVPLSTPPHISRAHPGWVFSYQGEGWLDPGIPDVNNFLLNVLLDLTRNYNIDGINFDYLRYPGRDFSDNDSYRKYGLGVPRDRWRKENLDRFVTTAYERLTLLRPLLKVGSSPLGIYGSDTAFVSHAAGEYYQDTRTWLRTGKLDYVAPQIYWVMGGAHGDPDFSVLVPAWKHLAGDRQVYPGIGAYKQDVSRELMREIDYTRQSGTEGQAYFRYASIANDGRLASRYSEPALIPPMPWKDAASPPPPVQLAVTETTTNVFYVQWIPPEVVADRSRAARYILYRWNSPRIPFDNPSAIARIVPGWTTSCSDTVRVPSGGTYYYALSALNAANSEGTPSLVSSGTMKEFVAMRVKLTDVTGLSASLSPRDGSPRMVAYSLARRVPVSLDLVTNNGRSDTVVATLVNDTQESGIYVVGLKGLQFSPGKYFVRLRAGDSTVEQPFDLP